MKDKQIQIPFRRSIVAVFFILWGFIWLFFVDTGPFDDLIGFFFTVFGAAFLSHSLNEILQYKKERSIRVDEKAAHHAFWILIGGMGVFQLINMLGRLKLSYSDAMQILIIVGLYSWIILMRHYNRTGDLS